MQIDAKRLNMDIIVQSLGWYNGWEWWEYTENTTVT